MDRHLDRLKELTEISRDAASLGDRKGRYARTPDYSKASAPSSRPRSDRGSTFHFAHKAKSKSNDMSDSNSTHTTSGAHQGYIERRSATEEIGAELRDKLAKAPMAEIEDAPLPEGFTYPARIVDPYRASFGTLGESKAERKQFWNDIERAEPSRARIQSRIIAELPAELSLDDRCATAREFCEVFEERGLPYWATIHAPGKRNDSRNFHLHITYFERPSGRREDGEWAHTIFEKRVKKSGNSYQVRPFKRNRHPDTRRRDWVKVLRKEYSDICNFYLSRSSHDKRYDPRSYKDSGIAKEATEHLGNKRSAIEAMGVETDAGQRNSKKEIRWKIEMAEAPWVTRARQLRNSSGFTSEVLSDRREALVAIAEEGITTARKSVSLSIVSDLLTMRTSSRDQFLKQEIERLSAKDDLSDLAVRSSRIIALSSERDALEERLPDLVKTADKCRSLGDNKMAQSRKLLKKFDSEMALFDPDLVLAEDGVSFDNIDDFVVDDAPIEDLDRRDMENIGDLFGEDLPSEKTAVQENTQLASEGPSETARDHQDDPVPTASDKTEETVIARAAEFRIMDIIQRVVDQHSQGQTSDDYAPQDAEDFPEAWAVETTKDKRELLDLDSKLAQLDNRALRLAAIATREATDLCPSGMLRDDFNRGWAVLRFEANRRGLDLDTGKHSPENASDAERARLHEDEDLCSIRVIRKNIARQRVRA